MNPLRFIIKLFLTALIVSSHIITTKLGLYLIRDEYKRRLFLISATSFFSKIFLIANGFKIDAKNIEHHSSDKNFLIISNHLSYIDILILASICPSVFITSVEVENTSFLGTLAKCGLHRLLHGP